MAKFKNLRYRDGFLTVGNNDLHVSKSDLSNFIQGIAMGSTWKESGQEPTLICTLDGYTLKGNQTDSKKLQVHLCNYKGQLVELVSICSNMDAFKDKKPVEIGTLIFRIIQYLSQFL